MRDRTAVGATARAPLALRGAARLPRCGRRSCVRECGSDVDVIGWLGDANGGVGVPNGQRRAVSCGNVLSALAAWHWGRGPTTEAAEWQSAA